MTEKKRVVRKIKPAEKNEYKFNPLSIFDKLPTDVKFEINSYFKDNVWDYHREKMGRILKDKKIVNRYLNNDYNFDNEYEKVAMNYLYSNHLATASNYSFNKYGGEDGKPINMRIGNVIFHWKDEMDLILDIEIELMRQGMSFIKGLMWGYGFEGDIENFAEYLVKKKKWNIIKKLCYANDFIEEYNHTIRKDFKVVEVDGLKYYLIVEWEY